MEIVNIKLSKLKPYEKNARININAIPFVQQSIKEFGFNVPILIDKDYNIIAGHTRYEASLRLNKKVVPCIFVTDLTDDQIREYRLVDNKVAEASSWDYEKLEKELLSIMQIDMSSLGFLSADDITNIEFLNNENFSTKKDDKTYICPCCGKEIQREELKKCE